MWPAGRKRVAGFRFQLPALPFDGFFFIQELDEPGCCAKKEKLTARFFCHYLNACIKCWTWTWEPDFSYRCQIMNFSFILLSFQMSGSPGLWRRGIVQSDTPIFQTDGWFDLCSIWNQPCLPVPAVLSEIIFTQIARPWFQTAPAYPSPFFPSNELTHPFD